MGPLSDSCETHISGLDHEFLIVDIQNRLYGSLLHQMYKYYRLFRTDASFIRSLESASSFRNLVATIVIKICQLGRCRANIGDTSHHPDAASQVKLVFVFSLLGAEKLNLIPATSYSSQTTATLQFQLKLLVLGTIPAFATMPYLELISSNI